MRVVQSIARALVGSPPPHASPPRVDALDPSAGLDLNGRQEAALRLMDADCVGYVLLTLHEDESLPATTGHVDLICAVKPEWWPPVAVTLERIIEGVRGRRRV